MDDWKSKELEKKHKTPSPSQIGLSGKVFFMFFEKRGSLIFFVLPLEVVASVAMPWLFKDVQWIKVAGIENAEMLWKDYDNGEILDLEIDDNKVFLLIEWKNWPPKPRLRTNDVSKIEIEAEKIYWENIPDLSDDCCKED